MISKEFVAIASKQFLVILVACENLFDFIFIKK